ncbi:MAG: leucine-rich repeat domain-containing protein [Clostridia bacterium]|nr:leucine-rich repeat domain-containing protein [Clostridia bacterium]
MKKFLFKLISLILCISLLVSLCACSSKDDDDIEDESSKGLEFTLNEDGESYKVSGIGECTDANVIIPFLNDSLPVTAIADGAFENCSFVKSVKIHKGITYIGSDAFTGTDSVKTINGICYVDKWVVGNDGTASQASIRENTVGIAEGSFEACKGLVSVVIPDSVKHICNNAFYYCEGLKTFNLPKKLVSIGENAFARCIKLEGELLIPDGTKEIGCAAFYSCKNLTSVKIPDSVTYVGFGAFAACRFLEYVDYIYYADKWAVSCERLDTANIREGTVGIAEKAFSDDADTVLKLLLKEVNIPDSVLYICEEAFAKNQNIKFFTVGKNNTAFKAVNGDLYSKDGSVLIKFTFDSNNFNNVKIEEGTKIISSYAFYRSNIYCPTSITIPSSVEVIGPHAFGNWKMLENAIFEDPDGWSIHDLETGRITPIEIDTVNTSNNIRYLTVDYPDVVLLKK